MSEEEFPGGQEVESRLRAVLFDAVGTLFRTRGTIGDVYSETAARHGVVAIAGELDQRFEARTIADGIPIDKSGWRVLVGEVFRTSPPFPDFDAFFEDVYAVFRSGKGWRLYPETRPVLEELQQKGIRMGLVTNFDERVHAVLHDLEIEPFFSTVQTAESSGFQKPDPNFFLEAAAALTVPPECTLVVGDDAVQDFQGAQRAGMRALLVDRRPQATQASFIIPDLRGLLPYVAGPSRGPSNP